MATLFRSIAKVWLVAALVLILAPSFARAQLYTLSSIGGWWDYDDASIQQVDPATGATISSRWVWVQGLSASGTYYTGLATHPMTGELYTLVPKPPTGQFNGCQHWLAKIIPTTGVATIIGNTGVCFSSLAFHTNGTLYGVTDGVPPSLFTLSTTDASTTFLISFGSTGGISGPVGGPALAFNPNDGLLYRSARFPPSGQIFQSINPNTLAVTDIPLSGSPTYEITALTHASGNTFLGADTGNQLFSITSSGVRTLIGSLDHLARGLAFAKMPGSVPLAALVDFDGDGKSDAAVYQTSSGNWFFVQSTSGIGQQLNFGGSSFLPVPGDYDGDGAVDTALYETGTGNWFVVGSTAGIFAPVSFGGAGFIPVPGDYDGDGKTDVAVYQQSTGNWFVVGTSTGFFTPALNFGGAGFIPVPGDYDGDGKTDTAVYQQSTGNWFVVGTSTGFFMPALNFGGSGFLPVPGDYDGDGKADPGVYQSSTGNWFVVGSSAGFFTPALNFGGSGFIPVPGDYDGDGETDVAVYGTSNGNWFVVGSTAGFFTPALNFGGPGFVPVLLQVTILRALELL